MERENGPSLNSLLPHAITSDLTANIMEHCPLVFKWSAVYNTRVSQVLMSASYLTVNTYYLDVAKAFDRCYRLRCSNSWPVFVFNKKIEVFDECQRNWFTQSPVWLSKNPNCLFTNENTRKPLHLLTARVFNCDPASTLADCKMSALGAKKNKQLSCWDFRVFVL